MTSQGATFTKGRRLNRLETAEFFGTSPQSVDKWVRQGCPIETQGSKGKSSAFNSAKVSSWLLSRASDADQAAQQSETALKKRKLKAEAEKIEIEVARARGDLAPVSDFERMQTAVMTMLRTNLRNIPARAVLRLLGCTDERTFKTTLTEEIDLCLTKLASEEIEIDDLAPDIDA